MKYRIAYYNPPCLEGYIGVNPHYISNKRATMHCSLPNHMIVYYHLHTCRVLLTSFNDMHSALKTNMTAKIHK